MKTTANTGVLGLYYPENLRAGDLLHVRADGALSTVKSTVKHRGGSQIVSFDDHADIVVCGATMVVVFS